MSNLALTAKDAMHNGSLVRKSRPTMRFHMARRRDLRRKLVRPMDYLVTGLSRLD